MLYHSTAREKLLQRLKQLRYFLSHAGDSPLSVRTQITLNLVKLLLCLQSQHSSEKGFFMNLIFQEGLKVRL